MIKICCMLIAVVTLSLNGEHTQKKKLRDFGYNKYSQWGEDGIIQEIFKVIGTDSKTCIEFGAWDGFAYSNTALLWESQGWKGILIESDTEKYKDLVRNVANYNCVPINAFVEPKGHSSLDSIISRLNIQENIDLLSIDIDGDDYYIFESLERLHPRVIICEHNPTLPAHLDIYAQPGTSLGCSVGALKRVAESKGYKLIAITETNSFFVDEKLYDNFSDYEIAFDKIVIHDFVKFLCFNYLGQPFIIGTTSNFAYGINSTGSNSIVYNDNKKNYCVAKISSISLNNEE